MNITFKHEPVMEKEIRSFFAEKTGKILVDCTAGGGGHLRLLAECAGSAGQVFGFDKDPRALKEDAAGKVLKAFAHVQLFHRPFSSVKEVLMNEGIDKIDGLVCDLGVSSHQLDDKARGFSLLADGPLDMRMDNKASLTAYQWLGEVSESTLADVLYNFSGERKSRVIARMIKKSWPIPNSTEALAKLIIGAVKQKHWTKIHPATKSFQAIRMAVNHELDELSSLLADLPSLLSPSGIAVFLSFHSVEDRLIKNAFKAMTKEHGPQESPVFSLLTKKPMVPTIDEINRNRRARSAKLRGIKRMF